MAEKKSHPIFLNFLIEGGWLTPEQAAGHRRTFLSTESWIGRLMVNHGLIGMEHVNEILNRQDLYGGFFGENTVEMGLVTRQQLETLLAAQELRRNIELIEELALAGVLDFGDGLSALTQFYGQRTAQPAGRKRKPQPV